MDHHKRKKDRLSNLPLNLIDEILMLLPLRDAVRTSILSRHWRYRWTSIPHLVFNQECAQTHLDGNDSNYLRSVLIVNKVLMCHKGPIHKFKCSKFVTSCPDIDQWIVYLSNHGIKEFILYIVSHEHSNLYQVPSHLFSCQDLNTLILRNCSIQIPPAFIGFANLTHLHLSFIKINDAALKNLVSKCRLLKRLALIALDGIRYIEIDSLNLNKIAIVGAFQGLRLSTPHLIHAMIGMHGEKLMNENYGHSLINALGSLPSIRRLWVLDHFIPVFTVGEKLPTFKWLVGLTLWVNFNSSIQLAGACCLIASTPSLKRLKITSTQLGDGSHKDDDFGRELPGCKLNCLLDIYIQSANGLKSELKFLEFILTNAPVLRRTTISFSSGMSEDERVKFLERLIPFRRASQATIKICD